MEERRTIDTLLTAVIAGIAVAVCVVLAELLHVGGIDVPYLCFLGGIVGCCAVGGWALASWALVYSALGIWYFFLPPTGSGWPEYSDTTHLVVFIAVTFFVCWIIDGQRRANDARTTRWRAITSRWAARSPPCCAGRKPADLPSRF